MKFYVIFCCVLTAQADIYLHNPRGSNNRLDEQGRERNNANRLFDSQNNNRGGYNVGSLYYYSGSRLQIEWTNQHSCMSENNHCELIIQYMCGQNVRDGATTTTIPENPMDCDNYNCDTDRRYGMHENYDYYMKCKMRSRNQGLFIADQKVGITARNTRQNPNGHRRGYECPEERDYYPYWHPTPWKDIAVMTNDATKCPYYQAESENVKGRGYCALPRTFMYKNMNNHHMKIPNNEQDCKAFKYPKDDPAGVPGVWVESPAHGVAAPDCMENQFSRDNHLGNGEGGYPLSYNWTIPNIEEENCAIRIRYNISTADYEAWEGVDSSNNRQNRKSDAADLDLSSLVGLANQEEALERGYKFKNNPEIEIFEGIDVKWRLAVNTAQFGRTFEDRSHTFAIRGPPEGVESATIHNLNVRGKRGNIVQVYPAVEYDFIPNTLEGKLGDLVHIQWTGSNTNPHNNDGQGLQRTDRSNIVVQARQAYSEGAGLLSSGGKYGHWGRSYPDILDNVTFLGLGRQDMVKLAMLEPHFRGEMSELDDAGTYFDLGPRTITMGGTYHYLSTRNNNFSNRSQKGKIVVQSYDSGQKSIGWNGGNMSLADGKTTLNVPRAAFQKLHNLRMEKWDKDLAKANLETADRVPPNDDFAGDVVVVHPEEQLTAQGQTFELKMPYEANGLQETIVYVSETHRVTWERAEARGQDGVLTIAASKGGMYVATNQLRGGAVAGIVIGLLVAVACIVLIVVCVIRKPPAIIQRTFAARV